MYALVLRPPLASVGPLLPLIDEDLGLTLAQQGFLTAIPVFSFGVGAFAGPALAKRLGLERSLFWLLAILTIAIGLRGWFGYTSLVVGTTVAGLAIAVSNVLLPSVIRGRFSKHVPQVTALFTTVLAMSASAAAASAVPIENSLGSWNLTLMVWLAPAVLALVLWRLALKVPKEIETSPVAAESTDVDHPAHAYFKDRYVFVSKFCEEYFDRLSASGYMTSGADSRTLAIALIALADGLQLQWLHDRTVDICAELSSFFKSVLSQAAWLEVEFDDSYVSA